MLKRFLVLGFVIFGLSFVISAQSGRRVRTSTPTPASTPASTLPTDSTTTTAEDSAGGVYSWDKYSESATNSARSIYDSPPSGKDKKSKKDKKEEATSKSQTADTAKTTDAAEDEVLKVETSLIS